MQRDSTRARLAKLEHEIAGFRTLAKCQRPKDCRQCRQMQPTQGGKKTVVPLGGHTPDELLRVCILLLWCTAPKRRVVGGGGGSGSTSGPKVDEDHMRIQHLTVSGIT